jgi:hypothetical protein
MIMCAIASGCAPRTIDPQAAMFSGECGGCGQYIAYRFNADKTLAIRVHVDEKKLALDDVPMKLELGRSPAVSVEVLQFAAPAESYFCDDVAGDAPPIATWNATSGTLTVELQQQSPPAGFSNATHRMSVAMSKLVLRNAKSGATVSLDKVKIPDVWVG